MNEKISIIIPVYKVEAYLHKCLDSILCQTWKNLEIILVDDGSPDQCGAICDNYAKKDSRIRVLHKRNAGVARARNDGLDLATGEYISFIDSDDWIAENTYEQLYQGLKKYHADCSVGSCVTVIDKNGSLSPKPKEKKDKAICQTASEAIKHVLLSGSAIWNRLFKKEIFHSLRFPLDRINDDEVTVLHAYAKCKKIVFLPDDTYFYRIRQNSITTSSFSVKQMDVFYNSVENLNFIKATLPELTECAEFKYIKAMLYCYANLKKLPKDETVSNLLTMLKKEIRQNRSLALHNSYLKLPLKALTIFCSL